jgi:hypothetical protein
MNNICKILLVCFLFTSCKKKIEKLEDPNLIDSVAIIKTIKLEHSLAAIISPNYMKKLTANSGVKTSYFIPDDKTIKYIEKELPKTSEIINNIWEDSEWQSLLKINAKNMKTYDKQYLGLVNAKNDSVVAIFIFNFETDPYNKKSKFGNEIIACSDGWCNTNTCSIEYNMRLKKFAQKFD